MACLALALNDLTILPEEIKKYKDVLETEKLLTGTSRKGPNLMFYLTPAAVSRMGVREVPFKVYDIEQGCAVIRKNS